MTDEAVARCRALAAAARFGALGTLARDPDGWPFATLVTVAFDAGVRPVMLLSRLAEHTKNLEACGRASLLVVEAGADDPLAAGRMTLVGECSRVPDGEREPAIAAFVAVHPEAAAYARFADFAPWRMEVAQVRWVGGFGRMTWIDGKALADD